MGGVQEQEREEEERGKQWRDFRGVGPGGRGGRKVRLVTRKQFSLCNLKIETDSRSHLKLFSAFLLITFPTLV